MLENIKPAIDSLADYNGDKTSANPDFVRKVTVRNIEISIEDIRKRSPVIDKLEQEGKVKIAGALYDMKTGAITFIDLD
jgi:carbonic anhydrase